MIPIGIQRDVADAAADGGGEFLVRVVGVQFAGVELSLQKLLLCGERQPVGANHGVARIDSPVRRDRPAVTLCGSLDSIKFGLDRTHVGFGARYRRCYLPGLLAVSFDVATRLTQVRAKGIAGFPLPVAEGVVDLLQAVAQPLQGRRAIGGGLEHAVDRIGVPALDVGRSQRRHTLSSLP